MRIHKRMPARLRKKLMQKQRPFGTYTSTRGVAILDAIIGKELPGVGIENTIQKCRAMFDERANIDAEARARAERVGLADEYNEQQYWPEVPAGDRVDLKRGRRGGTVVEFGVGDIHVWSK
ncbi:hypothetical protein BcepSauron_310 [Burkholderia phage BcepSauron]|uniref:Uncharacterized protein n=2 Tax=Sarumanvirus TaxID=2843450 RepID=A0A482MNK4_9CAUD|nr:hypothetical protein H1O16_gp309 [Burkholderia phage BcepSaruman]YP_009904688.1 hypothetical protein H1O17_gp310 [Burkholderia phage BcepSauron]QBQ74690.1 hypothetical protein BcepSauron_310 [Burkholderia phage BcepSauron]QBX06722.1 hypothetical protein BcepSaruman_309 [Burkholderia phage BcepSaruman]